MARATQPVTTETRRAVQLRVRVGGSVVVGVQELGGRSVVLARSEPDRRRGALGRHDGESLAAGAELALRLRVPLVIEVSSSGADISEGVDALHGWGTAAAAIASCSGVVPVVAAVTGPAISGPALLLSLADLAVMSPSAVAFVSGPSMVAEFTGVQVSPSELGGVTVHSASSGLCAIESPEPLQAASELLAYLPQSADDQPPFAPSSDSIDRSVPELRDVVPTRATASYDVRAVATAVADHGDVCELWPRWAP